MDGEGVALRDAAAESPFLNGLQAVAIGIAEQVADAEPELPVRQRLAFGNVEHVDRLGFFERIGTRIDHTHTHMQTLTP